MEIGSIVISSMFLGSLLGLCIGLAICSSEISRLKKEAKRIKQVIKTMKGE